MTARLPVLLDTSAVIDLERLDLREHASSTAAISAVTLAELAYGLATDDPVRLAERVERYHVTQHQFVVLAFGVAEAKMYGTAAALVRQHGRNPRPRRMDLQIAATAAVAGLPVLTMNVKDFKDVERLVEVVPIRQV